MTARTPLFAALRRAVAASEATMDRRSFLRHAAAAGGAALLAGCGLPAVAGPRVGGGLAGGLVGASGVRAAGARVAVVGAGIGGLSAVHALAKAGIAATVYEASDAPGGRIRSARGLITPGQVTELGAEFIDASHREMRALADEFGLGLLDTGGATSLTWEAHFFGGEHYGDRDLANGIAPYLPRFAADQQGLPRVISYKQPGAWTALDRLSIAEYLDQIGMSGWVRRFVEAAYTTEYGLDPGEQSALNLVSLVGTALDQGEWSVIGDSDERYKIKGGNEGLIEAMAQRYADRTRLGHRLVAIAPAGPAGAGYKLTFATAQGPTAEVVADAVVLALPFSLLRDVAIAVPLPEAKRRAIAELAYGTNTKLLAGFKTRVWRDTGYLGGFVGDGGLPTGWDHGLMQGGTGSGLTIFLGGAAGVRAGEGTPAEQIQRRLPELERLYPGARAAYTGRAARCHWPSEPFARGSYACYRPGQGARFRGAEGEAVGRLLFAGEHCHAEQQGFMEGAALSGKAAARAITRAFTSA